MDVYSTLSRKCASADAAGGAIVASVRHANRAAFLALAAIWITAPTVPVAAAAPSPKPDSPSQWATIDAAAAPLPKPDSPSLWATIDVCDTPAHPDTIGIRGSMPGTGDSRERMFMEFAIEYRSATGHWHFLLHGVEGFVAVGRASYRERQAGEDFQVAPSSARSYTLRGIVVFEWRAHGIVIAQTVRSTSAGRGVSAGADPPGYSAATCTISAAAAGRS
jgi:hypothetical protein